MPKRKNFGDTADVHDHQMREGFKRAAQAMRNVERAARKNNCSNVINELLIARANLSHAYAHMSSYSAPHNEEFANAFCLHTRTILPVDDQKRSQSRRLLPEQQASQTRGETRRPRVESNLQPTPGCSDGRNWSCTTPTHGKSDTGIQRVRRNYQ